MDNIKISLAIFGNQNSNSGFQPLYWINDPPQQLENIVPPGMDENPYFFTLQVLPAHTQYTLIHNRVSSYMSVRPGVLKMAVAIPKGYRLCDGISPLKVLLDVRQKFVDTCMTLRDAHAKAYNFKEKMADPDVFAAIVDSYRLEPDEQPHLPMTGTEDAVMLLDDTDIAQLFIAPQRPEFQRLRRIVIANKGNTSVYKTQLNSTKGSTIQPSQPDDPVTQASPTLRSDTRLRATRVKRKRLIIVLCSLLVIGGGTFLFWPSSEKKKEMTETAELMEEEAEAEPEVEEISAAEKQLLKSIRANQRLLADSLLTFDDILQLTQWANDSIDSDDISSSTLARYDDLVKQIMVYDTLRQMCGKQEYNGNWKYLRNQKVLFNTALDSLYATGYLHNIHYHYLRAAYMVPKPCHDDPDCFNDIKWTEDNREKIEVFKRFLFIRDHNNPFNSFKDIYDIALGREVSTDSHSQESGRTSAGDEAKNGGPSSMH